MSSPAAMPIPTAMMPGPSILRTDTGSGMSRVTGVRTDPRSVVGRVNAMVPPQGEAGYGSSSSSVRYATTRSPSIAR